MSHNVIQEHFMQITIAIVGMLTIYNHNGNTWSLTNSIYSNKARKVTMGSDRVIKVEVLLKLLGSYRYKIITFAVNASFVGKLSHIYSL